jgi:hypothetical protein
VPVVRAVGAYLHVAGLVDHQHRLGVVRMLHHAVIHVVADLVGVNLARRSRCCMPSGVLSPAHSAMVRQFLRG